MSHVTLCNRRGERLQLQSSIETASFWPASGSRTAGSRGDARRWSSSGTRRQGSWRGGCSPSPSGCLLRKIQEFEYIYAFFQSDFQHSYTHSHTDGDVNQAMRQTAHPERSGFFLRDTSSLSWRSPGLN